MLAYFERRLSQAPRDAHFTFEFVNQNARTRAEREAGVNAITFMGGVL